jgi:hypothetical protein
LFVGSREPSMVIGGPCLLIDTWEMNMFVYVPLHVVLSCFACCSLELRRVVLKICTSGNHTGVISCIHIIILENKAEKLGWSIID